MKLKYSVKPIMKLNRKGLLIEIWLCNQSNDIKLYNEVMPLHDFSDTSLSSIVILL